MEDKIGSNCSWTDHIQDTVPIEPIKNIGRLFYIVNPEETTFENVEDVPNYYMKSYPYFLVFMLLEHIILRLEGRKGIRLNDGVTSISNGLLYECGRILFRGFESLVYTWIFTNWKIVDLSWDSQITWYAALIGVDFCYYWLHRACHEIHLLWAQHQVHHTSEDFNMGVGIRQSVFQGWFSFIFYLPLAFIIPPSHFVTHQQLSLIYMFWIHTETIDSLGPLEYIFNTPSHHRVHHGCNDYCIDVNYGGLLIIWDRMFGTYSDERNKDEIVYGLIYNQPSFNPIHLQTFYTRYVIEKYQRFSNIGHKFKAVFHKPSWEPDGIPAEGVLIREKYDTKLPLWCNIYLAIHFAIIVYSFQQFAMNFMNTTSFGVLAYVINLITSLSIIGMMFDGYKYAAVYELIRCSLMMFLSKRFVAQNWTTDFVLSIQVFYVISAMFWCLNTLKLIQNIKKASKMD